MKKRKKNGDIPSLLVLVHHSSKKGTWDVEPADRGWRMEKKKRSKMRLTSAAHAQAVATGRGVAADGSCGTILLWVHCAPLLPIMVPCAAAHCITVVLCGRGRGCGHMGMGADAHHGAISLQVHCAPLLPFVVPHAAAHHVTVALHGQGNGRGMWVWVWARGG